MAKVGAQRAAELTRKSKSTIQRAMKNGKLSFELDSNGRRVIDASELDRVFGLEQQDTKPNTINNTSVQKELEKASSLLEMERHKMRIKMLEQQIETQENQIEDLKDQRDSWQKQATQVLLTSEYSQKQAEKYREELDERKRRAEERRRLHIQEQKTPDNQNAQVAEDPTRFNFWKKIKGTA